MKRWTLGLAAIATTAALAALLWQLDRPGALRHAALAAVTAPPARSAAPAGSTRSHAGSAPSMGGDVPAPLTNAERSTIDMERVLAGDVPTRLRMAAAQCYDGSAFSYKALEGDARAVELAFTVAQRAGTISFTDVRITSGIGDPDLEECIVEATSEVAWRDRVNADFTMPMSDSISMLSLKKYSDPMPHERQERPESPDDGDFGALVR